MKRTADYVIIGGGISGVAIGYNLLKNGAENVVILEKSFLASGATGRCGAGIRQQWGTELNCIMSKYSCEFFEHAVEELGYDGDIEFHQGGYMMLVSTEQELAMMRQNVALQNRLGISSRILDLAQAKEIIPFLNTEPLLAATFYEQDGHLNPFHTTQAFANAFRRMGGTIYPYTRVTGICTAHGRITGVKTDKGTIATECVINAAGGWSNIIAEMAGTSLPVYSERHNILVTEPVEQALGPMIMSFSLNLYCQQVPHGSFIMGRTDYQQPRDFRITSDSQFPDHMSRTVTGLLPPLRRLRMLRQWAGLYNMSPDKQAIYSRSEEVTGFYSACGFSGHGFMMAPATGRSMAELVLGLAPTLPWQRLDTERFTRGALILEPAVV